MAEQDGTREIARTGAVDAADLGVTTLAGIISGSAGGIVLIAGDRSIIYANPAACTLLGQRFADLRGADVLDHFPSHERGIVASRLDVRPGERRETFSSAVCAADGQEREIVCSIFAVQGPGGRLVVIGFWDLSGPHTATRTAVALAQTAARLVGTAPTNDLLVDIARRAVEGTRARACGLAVVGEDDRFVVGGGFGPGYGLAPPPGQTRSRGWAALAEVSASGVVDAQTNGAIRIGSVPGKASVVPGARSIWEADPLTREFAATLVGLDWESAVYVPLAWQNKVIGLLTVYLPPGIRGPEETELAFFTALADQASLAVMTAKLAEEAASTAALAERGRLARDLHDSVSQALFSMTMHVRAAQLSMSEQGVADRSGLARSIGQMAELTRVALAEMRALVFELRPGALAEEGLVGALRRQATALAVREGLTLTVEGPDERLGLDAETEEHLYRIVSEALNNVVKHAQASAVTVHVSELDGAVQIAVGDDGRGFDPHSDYPGHLGLSTMAQRARAVDAYLLIDSRPGAGTIVTVTVATAARPSEHGADQG